MICPKCRHTQADGLAECLKCGVIFAKLRAYLDAQGFADVALRRLGAMWPAKNSGTRINPT